MNAWILIVVLTAASGHSTVAMQEFNTLQACQFASSNVSLKAGSYVRGMFCVPKGETK